MVNKNNFFYYLFFMDEFYFHILFKITNDLNHFWVSINILEEAFFKVEKHQSYTSLYNIGSQRFCTPHLTC